MHFAGAPSMPIEGWLAPCRYCRQWTAATIPGDNPIPVCKRCQCKVADYFKAVRHAQSQLLNLGQQGLGSLCRISLPDLNRRRSSSGTAPCLSQTDAASPISAPVSAVSTPSGVTSPSLFIDVEALVTTTRDRQPSERQKTRF